MMIPATAMQENTTASLEEDSEIPNATGQMPGTKPRAVTETETKDAHRKETGCG